MSILLFLVLHNFNGLVVVNDGVIGSVNLKRVAGHKAAYAARYPERVAAAKAKNYATHGEEYQRRAQDRRRAVPGERAAQERAKYAKDPKPFLMRNSRRAERDRAVGGVFTVADKCKLFADQSGMCANLFCEADLSVVGFHADHKNPVLLGGSHDISNRQLLCPTCNHRKGAMTNESFLAQQAEIARKA